MRLFVCLFIICLFELILNAPVHSNGHVGTLPPFYRTLTLTLGCHGIQKSLKYINPSIKATNVYMYMYGWYDLNRFAWAGSLLSGLTVISCSVSSVEALPGCTSRPSTYLGPNGRGPDEAMHFTTITYIHIMNCQRLLGK